MTRLKVAIVAPSLGILGGQAVQADRLLKAWDGDEALQAWLVPVNPLLPRPLRFAARVKYLRTIATQITYIPQLVREIAKADVVHVFSASYASFLLAPLPAVLVARALGRPVLLNYRSGEAPDHLARSAIARATLARVTRNVVPSPFLVDVFHRFGINAEIVPNLVDFDLFRYRERLPLRPKLLSTRNFDDLYNVACTIRAFRLIQDRWPGASLTLVGGGVQESALRTLVSDLNLAQVNFAGRVAPDRIAPYYADHDIYIQSPNIDNTPTSILEAFASGLPVVSTGAGGIPKILEHGIHGLLAPIDDSAALGAHVLHLLSHPAEAQRMARAGRDSCRSCAWPVVRERWLSQYRSIVAAARSPHETRRHRFAVAPLLMGREHDGRRRGDDHAA